MFKKILLTTAVLALAGVLVFGAVTLVQAQGGVDNPGSPGTGGGYRGGAGAQNNPARTARGGAYAGQGINLLPADPDGLSSEEIDALLFMREEEKLARDVYLALYDKWGLPVFQNIADSEQAHTNAIKALLDRYGIEDPASAQAGVFTNPELQALYTRLVAQGSLSVAEAIKVGGAIEEIDILDLQTRLAQLDSTDLVQVFNNLLNGSSNHLKAFAGTLNMQTGKTYEPQYLSAEAYQAILASSGPGSTNGGGVGSGGHSGGRGGRR